MPSPFPYGDQQQAQRREDRNYDELEQLRTRNAELERQLAEFQHSEFHPDWSLLQASQESLREYMSLVKELTERAEQAEQRIAESRKQEPDAYIYPMAYGSHASLCKMNKPADWDDDEAMWFEHPLYRSPVVPPDVGARMKAEALEDARRYQRLRIIGVAPYETRHLSNGTVLRFQNLDSYCDEEIAAHPSRGEYELRAKGGE